jgi:hypothetical protein
VQWANGVSQVKQLWTLRDQSQPVRFLTSRKS